MEVETQLKTYNVETSRRKHGEYSSRHWGQQFMATAMSPKYLQTEATMKTQGNQKLNKQATERGKVFRLHFILGLTYRLYQKEKKKLKKLNTKELKLPVNK